MVSIETLNETVNLLEINNIKYLIFGGWALDGVRNAISREHGDIDMYVSNDQIEDLTNLFLSQNLELKQREKMYFIDSDKLKLGVVLITSDEKEVIAHGNKTTAYYPKDIFNQINKGQIGELIFSIVPNEILALEAQFSKYEADKMLGTQLNINKDLFDLIRIEKIRDSRSV